MLITASPSVMMRIIKKMLNTVAPSTKKSVLTFLFIPTFLFKNKRDHNQYPTYHGRGIGHVEGRPPFEAEESIEPDIDEVHHPLGAKKPVHHVPESTANDGSQGPSLQPGELRRFYKVDHQCYKENQGKHDE